MATSTIVEIMPSEVDVEPYNDGESYGVELTIVRPEGHASIVITEEIETLTAAISLGIGQIVVQTAAGEVAFQPVSSEEDGSDLAELARTIEEAAEEPEGCSAQTYPQTRETPAEYCERYAMPGSDYCAHHGGPVEP